MKRTSYIAAALILLAGCAKDPDSITSQLEKRAFDAWIETNRESFWTMTGLGSWIVESTPGDPQKPVGEKTVNPYVRVEYTARNLKGTITGSTSEDVAIQLGTRSNTGWYGPITYNRASSFYAGVDEIISAMNVGGTCRFVIPGWLLSTTTYDTAQEYNSNVTGKDALIYDLKVVEAFDSVTVWEMDQIRKAAGDLSLCDTLETGVYYRQTKASDNPDTTYSDGNSVYVNYVCRRALDGKAVDSNIKDTCKIIGSYVKGSTYEPLLVNYQEDYTDMTMTSSETSMISGFARAIHDMKPHEKGLVYMTSAYGYADDGSGSSIPAFCPLIFEIEITDKPE